ncbi:unnamed protein product [Trichobilharzia regenti]|nr:unnamed protein product [Trichobilharzia regenti]
MINSVITPINQTNPTNWTGKINVKANLSNSSTNYKFDDLSLMQVQTSNIYPTTSPTGINQPENSTSMFSGKAELSSHRIPSMHNFLICIYSLFIICGATFNLTLIFALLKFRKQTLSQNITNLFVLCLAVSDVFLCSVSMPIQLYYEITENYKPSTDFCRVLFSSFGIPMYISCLTILLIAFDRYRLIVYPLKTQLTPKAALGLISIIIVFSVVNSIPVAIQISTEGTDDYLYCVETWPSAKLRFAYSVSIFVILVLLPLSASGGFYLAIYRRLKQRPCQLNASKEAEKRKKRTTSLLVITVVCFAACWTPWCLYSLLLEVQALLNAENDLSSINRFGLSNDELRILSDRFKKCQELIFSKMNQPYFLPMPPNLISPTVELIPGKHLKIIDLLLKLFAMGSACVNPLLYGWLNEPIRIVMRRQYSRFEECFKPNQSNKHNINNSTSYVNANRQKLCSKPTSGSKSTKFLTPPTLVKSISDYNTRSKLIVEKPTGGRQVNSQDTRSASYTEGVGEEYKKLGRFENTFASDNNIINDDNTTNKKSSCELILPKIEINVKEKHTNNHYDRIDKI